MPAIFDRSDPSKPEQGTPSPAGFTLPAPGSEKRRVAKLLERTREFVARFNAQTRWIKEFLHDGR